MVKERYIHIQRVKIITVC